MNIWEQLQPWDFLSGLGLFLLGMLLLEQGLGGLASKSLKSFLRQQTISPIRGVLSGTVATALLQSSSLVGLITLAFVGSGILELRNALGIIFGSNLGTTITGWLVATIGFKLDMVAFAQPMLALGAFGTVFLKKDSRVYFYFNLVLGLGLLLMGLGQMKDGFSALTDHLDVSVLRDYPALVYLLAGALFTAIIQSSSATMMILLSALNAGVIDLHVAAALVVGADLGTTSTVLLAAMKGSADKRRVAISHFTFNLVTDIIAFLLIPVLLYVIAHILEIGDPLFALVAFHSMFNVLGIALFVPLTDSLVRFLKWIIPDVVPVTTRLCTYIYAVPLEITEAAAEAIRKELSGILYQTLQTNASVFSLLPSDLGLPGYDKSRIQALSFERNYADIKQKAGELLRYTNAVQNYCQDKDDSREISVLNHGVRNVVYAAKHIKDIRHNLPVLRNSDSAFVRDLEQGLGDNVLLLYRKILDILTAKNPSATEFDAAGRNIQVKYEQHIAEVYLHSDTEKLDYVVIASLLNLNHAVNLSNHALLETTSVLLRVQDPIAMQEIVQPVL